MTEAGHVAEPGYPVFLLGMHRGGTTFVQRVLNCHAGLTIWGENLGLVFGRLRIPRSGVDVRLLDRALRARVNSSFVDVGRVVPEADRERILALYDEASEAITQT